MQQNPLWWQGMKLTCDESLPGGNIEYNGARVEHGLVAYIAHMASILTEDSNLSGSWNASSFISSNNK